MKFDIGTIHHKSLRDIKYVVQNKDSLYKIAKEYGVSVESLLQANNLKDTLIYPNQVLIIPIKSNNGATYFMEYVIKPDDTLELVATKNNITIDELIEYNDITKLILKEDQTLSIPKKYRVYEVIDTDEDIDDILNKNNITLEELIAINYDNLFKPGTKVYVK